jgi:hypothetical protein
MQTRQSSRVEALAGTALRGRQTMSSNRRTPRREGTGRDVMERPVSFRRRAGAPAARAEASPSEGREGANTPSLGASPPEAAALTGRKSGIVFSAAQVRQQNVFEFWASSSSDEDDGRANPKLPVHKPAEGRPSWARQCAIPSPIAENSIEYDSSGGSSIKQRNGSKPSSVESSKSSRKSSERRSDRSRSSSDGNRTRRGSADDLRRLRFRDVDGGAAADPSPGASNNSDMSRCTPFQQAVKKGAGTSAKRGRGTAESTHSSDMDLCGSSLAGSSKGDDDVSILLTLSLLNVDFHNRR